jgi:type III pantothenate kinase
MLLALDIGNTHTVLGVYDDTALVVHRRTATVSFATEDDLWVRLRALLETEPAGLDAVKAVILASVVPVLTETWTGMCRRHLGLEPLLVSAAIDLGIEVRVQPPEAAGADRLANAVAARHRYGAPAVVVDLGTATTFDVIDAGGAYIGGVIAPGVKTASEELFRRAARLAKVDILPPERVIGSTTEGSLRSGLYLGTLAMIDGLLARITEELGTPPRIIFTGGLSTPFQDAFAERGEVDPWLTLEGLRLIHERVRGASG